MSTKNKKTTGNFKYKAELEDLIIAAGKKRTPKAGQQARELFFTKARSRIESLKHGGKPKKGDYELGVGEIRCALHGIDILNSQIANRIKSIVEIRATLCGCRKLPAPLTKRMLSVLTIKPGDMLTAERGTAKV